MAEAFERRKAFLGRWVPELEEDDRLMEAVRGDDPVRRWVHRALGLYLLPAVVLVLLLGGLFWTVEIVFRALARLVQLMSDPRAARHGHGHGPASPPFRPSVAGQRHDQGAAVPANRARRTGPGRSSI